MTGTLGALLSATVTFVIGHFVLASMPVREVLIERIGLSGFRFLFSIIAVVTLTWIILAYKTAPYVEWWTTSSALNIVPLIVMPFACVFIVSGLTTHSVTMVGGEHFIDEPNAVRGIMTVTRHPVLWAVALLSISHLAVTGDSASLVLFGGITVLALGGMVHIDHRRGQLSNAAWGPIALRTSMVPFAAAATGRTRIDWAGIGIARIGGGLALYCLLIGIHGGVFGVTPFLGKSL